MLSFANKGRNTTWATGAIVSAFLAALYLNNSNWFYTRPGWLDPWYHVGYGLYYDNPLFLNDYYKVSRLPWNLYQFVFRQLLLPIPAEIAIHFSLYVGSSILLYIICARLLSQTAGIIVAVFSAAFTLLHANGGADYHNAMCGPLFFAVIATMLWSFGRDTRTFLLVGVVLAILIHVNTMYIFFVPLFAGLGASIAFAQGRQWRYVFQGCGWVCGGVLLCTIGLIVINLAFGRSWSFFLPQIQYAADMATDGSRNIWWQPWSMSWVKSAAYIGFIYGAALIAVSELARILLCRLDKQRPVAVVIHVLYLLEVGIWSLWQTFGHNTALQPPYVAYPLYGPLLLSIGTWLGSHFGELRWSALVALAVTFAIFLYLALVDSSQIIGAASKVTAIAPLWPGVLLAGLYVILLAAKNQAVVMTSTLLLMPISNALVVTLPSNYAPSHCALNAEAYDYIVRNSVVLTRTVAGPEHVYVWFQEGEPMETPACTKPVTASDIAYSFTSIGHSYIEQPFPMKPIDRLSSDRLKTIGMENAVIVAVTADENKAKLLASRFESEGIHLRYDGRLLPPYGERLVPFYIFRTAQSQ